MKQSYLNSRTLSAILHDCVAIFLSWIIAFALRFNFSIPVEHNASMWLALLWVMPMQLGLFIFFGLYKGIWRFASLLDLKRILIVVMLGAVFAPAILFMFDAKYVIPRTVLLLYPIFLLMLMGGSRFAYRLWKEHSIYGAQLKKGKPVKLPPALRLK